MDPRLTAIRVAIFILALTTLIYGIRFLKKKNYLLAVESFVVTFSASNFLNFFLSGSEVSYVISFFCDAFSRGFGIPLITTAAMMCVTHGYKPSLKADIGFFVGSLLGTFVLVAPEFDKELSIIKGPLPYFYVVVWAIFSAYTSYFCWRLWQCQEKRQAVNLMLANLAALGIACIYDFYKIPGDDTNVILNFVVLAVLTWSYLIGSIYHAYVALDNAKDKQSDVAIGGPLSQLA